MADTEKFTIKSEDVVKKIKELIKEGNIRRIRLIHDGRLSLISRLPSGPDWPR